MSWNNNVQSATHDGLEVAADRDKKSQVLLIFDRENMPHNLFILANLNWNDRNMYLEYLFLVTRVHEYDVTTCRRRVWSGIDQFSFLRIYFVVLI